MIPGILPTMDISGCHDRGGMHNPGLWIFGLIALIALLRGGRGGLFGGGEGGCDAATTAATENIGEIKGTQKALAALSGQHNLDQAVNSIHAQVASIPARSALDVRASLCEPLCQIESGVARTVKDGEFERAICRVTGAVEGGDCRLDHHMERGFCATNTNVSDGFCKTNAHIDRELCHTNREISDKFCHTNRNIDDRYHQLVKIIDDKFALQTLREAEEGRRCAEERIRLLERDRDHDRVRIDITNIVNTIINNNVAPALTALSSTVNVLQSGMTDMARAMASLRSATASTTA
jgi:hypothetical protein